MPKDNLPTYAIVELLIRLEKHYPTIGNYKDHVISDDIVVVKTTNGSVKFPHVMVVRQFEAPEQITDTEMIEAASSFRALS